MSSYATATTLAEVLDIEKLDVDLYRGVHGVGADRRPSLYGGQVAAQALRAAGNTVAPDRFPHSLHGYFLRAGRADLPVILKVDRDRDGGSFSARHVSAIQDGRVIFSMLASFHVDAEGQTRDAMPVRPVPDGGGERPTFERDLIQMQEIDPARIVDGRYFSPDHLRFRSLGPLPDDRLVHTCAITYLSDYGTGLNRFEPPLDSPGGPSIDHALWFQHPARADQWITIDMWPAQAIGSRALYMGAMRDAEGNLVASLTQEMLLRPYGLRPQPKPAAEAQPGT